jgi:hypothetical protein
MFDINIQGKPGDAKLSYTTLIFSVNYTVAFAFVVVVVVALVAVVAVLAVVFSTVSVVVAVVAVVVVAVVLVAVFCVKLASNSFTNATISSCLMFG